LRSAVRGPRSAVRGLRPEKSDVPRRLNLRPLSLQGEARVRVSEINKSDVV
jgi:hypothetical protein